jgi:hypothetical protein
MTGWRKRTIMEMALEAGFEGCAELTWENVICTEELEAFAKLVREDALAQRTWVGLTDEEISDSAINNPPSVHEFARAIEAKLKEKNT